MVPVLTGPLKVPMKSRRSPSSLVAVTIFSVPALITHAVLGHIDWFFALPLMIGVVPGARIGAHLTIGSSERTIRRLFGTLIVVLASFRAGEAVALSSASRRLQDAVVAAPCDEGERGVAVDWPGDIRKRTEAVLARSLSDGGTATRRPEEVLVEEPMEIRLDGERVATTMRTPGHDFELAVGWCWPRALLADGATVSGVRYCATGSAVETEFNVVSVDTDGHVARVDGAARHRDVVVRDLRADSIDDLVDRLKPLDRSTASMPVGLARARPRRSTRQELFERTGGSHAAAACVPMAT